MTPEDTLHLQMTCMVFSHTKITKIKLWNKILIFNTYLSLCILYYFMSASI